jgi:hypothetical protein
MEGQIVLLLLAAAFTAQAQTRPASKIPPDMATFMEGVQLNDDQVAAIKMTLDTSPDDLNAHLKLLAYYSLRKNGEGDEHSEFAKYLLWMIDHRPESFIFELGIIQLKWEPSPTLWNEYKKHWEQAAAAHPKDSAVLSHTPEAVFSDEPILGLSYARKSVDADSNCTHCRNTLGNIVGFVILRLSESPGGWKAG